MKPLNILRNILLYTSIMLDFINDKSVSLLKSCPDNDDIDNNEGVGNGLVFNLSLLIIVEVWESHNDRFNVRLSNAIKDSTIVEFWMSLSLTSSLKYILVIFKLLYLFIISIWSFSYDSIPLTIILSWLPLSNSITL